MAELPSEEEPLEAVMKLKSGKAAGESGILPEMVKAVMETVWRCWWSLSETYGKKPSRLE